MNYRSFLLVSRLVRFTNPSTIRYLTTTSFNRQLLISSSSFIPQQKQYNRYLAEYSSGKKSPGRIRRFFRWFGWGSNPTIVKPPPPPEEKLTSVQRLKRFFAIAPSLERFFLRSRIIEDDDLARLISKTAAVTVYAFVGVMTLGTLGVDTKPLLAGIGITGFTVGFALKEVATNFISGIFLVINKPFVKGCRLKIHGSGGGIEGLVRYIDIRYVHLQTKDRGLIMVPSAIVYTNPFTVFPVDDEANVGFIDMTKPPTTDTKKPLDSPPSSDEKSKDKKLKMTFDAEPAGSFKKTPFREKL